MVKKTNQISLNERIWLLVVCWNLSSKLWYCNARVDKIFRQSSEISLLDPLLVLSDLSKIRARVTRQGRWRTCTWWTPGFPGWVSLFLVMMKDAQLLSSFNQKVGGKSIKARVIRLVCWRVLLACKLQAESLIHQEYIVVSSWLFFIEFIKRAIKQVYNSLKSLLKVKKINVYKHSLLSLKCTN